MRRLPVRWRWAAWCAALATCTGVVAVVITLHLTGTQLRARNDELVAQEQRAAPPGPPGPPGAGPAPAQTARGRIADEVIADARRTGLLTVVGLAGVSLAVGWIVAGRMVRPLRAMTRVADEVSGGRMGERMGATGNAHDDLGRLARAFDDMLDRLDRAFEAQRSFVADASHELRTPLATVRTEIEVALDDPDADEVELRAALERASAALDRGIHLVESLLALSRSETLVDVGDVDLAEVAARSMETHPSPDRHLDERLDPAPTRGDPVLVERLVDNLVDNAARYTPAGGTIHVRTGVVGPHAVLTISNTGAVMSDEEVARLLDRFVRRAGSGGPQSPTGTGVGLAVSAAIVRTHGGELVARPRPGGGLTIEVRLGARPGGGASGIRRT